MTSFNINNEQQCYQLYYMYTHHPEKTEKIQGIDDIISKIKSKYPDKLSEWEKLAEKDTTQYDIGDMDFSSFWDTVGSFGNAVVGTSNAAGVVGNVAIGAASKALPTMAQTAGNVAGQTAGKVAGQTAGKLAGQTGKLAGQVATKAGETISKIAKVCDWVMLAVAGIVAGIGLATSKKHEKLAQELERVFTDLQSANSAIAAQEEIMRQVIEFAQQKQHEAEVANTKANEDINKEVAENQTFAKSMNYLMEEYQAGRLTEDEAAQFLALCTYMSQNKEDVGKIAANAQDVIAGLFLAMGYQYQKLDESKSMIDSINEFMLDAQEAGKALKANAKADMIGQYVNAGSAGILALRFGMKAMTAGGPFCPMTYIYAAGALAAAGFAVLSVFNGNRDKKAANQAGMVVDFTKEMAGNVASAGETYELSTEDLGKELDNMDQYDLYIPEEGTFDVPDGEGITANGGANGAGGAGGAGGVTEPKEIAGDKKRTSVGATFGEVALSKTSETATLDYDETGKKVKLASMYANAILNSGVARVEGGTYTFNNENYAKILAKLCQGSFTEKEIKDFLDNPQAGLENDYNMSVIGALSGNSKGTVKRSTALQRAIDFYKPIFAAAANGWTRA